MPAIALAVTAIFSLGSPRSTSGSSRGTTSTARAIAGSTGLDPASCPAGTLPDGEACVHWPGADEGNESAESETSVNAHRDRMGRWVVYDEIPRRPDRPADYDAYRYPVPCGAAAKRPCVASGYDLDRSDALQRRARGLRQIGHGAVDLLEPRGTPVVNVNLEHQEGDAEVVYVGTLFGTTVVTRTSLREGGSLRDYLLLFGHLASAAAGVQKGARLREGDLVGFVGDTGSPNIVHLHLEVRRLRDGVALAKLAPTGWVDGAYTVVCDPRNVLPLR